MGNCKSDVELLREGNFETSNHFGGIFCITKAVIQHLLHVLPVDLSASIGRQVVEYPLRIKLSGIFRDQRTKHDAS
jgi:hypothetical protein